MSKHKKYYVVDYSEQKTHTFTSKKKVEDFLNDPEWREEVGATDFKVIIGDHKPLIEISTLSVDWDYTD
ncbi:MAG: hypothetical protein COA78_20410 [Blastopirellula sp.]|nr:MAG: hypothetical protein COA78_20410 [Blastopirellula sp.]